MSKILSLCRKRGFLFPSSEIYGGLASCWDYGPLGVQMKNNIKRLWMESMTRRRDVLGLDSSILMHSKVWEASGHINEFSDPLSDCRKCKHRFCPSPEQIKSGQTQPEHIKPEQIKPDQIKPEQIKSGQSTCPNCGSSDITPARNFNLMFKSSMGPVEGEGSTVYLRPETAQGIYVNFVNVQQSLRPKVPFGIAQIGKAFRNEITPSHFIFRMREFEQMEMQFFIPPEQEQENKWFEYWKKERVHWLTQMGLKEGDISFNRHQRGELAHYAKYAEDIEYEFADPLGRQELEGLHVRGDFDLSSHQTFSGKKLKYFDPERKTSYLPHIIETSIGCDRLFLALLSAAYQEEEMADGQKRVVLNLDPSVAPIQLALLPLQKDPKILALTDKIQHELRKTLFIETDEAGSIGKRYRRQDEIGTPLCATVDFDSLKNQDVTVRRLDTLDQNRIPIAELENYLNDPSTLRDPATNLDQWTSTLSDHENPLKQGKKDQYEYSSMDKNPSEIPKSETFYYPIFKFLGKGEGYSLSEIQHEIQRHFNLPDKALQRMTRGGNQSQFINRINWALSHLKKLNFIIKGREGWRLSPLGKVFLDKDIESLGATQSLALEKAFLDKDIEGKEKFLIRIVRFRQRGMYKELLQNFLTDPKAFEKLIHFCL